MKVSKEQASANRQAILEAAARLYRERGLAGVGVAEIMREAGFTHGGFYGHFESKEALAAQACELAFTAPHARMQDSLVRHGGDARPWIERYLRHQHRDEPGQGCAMPTLAVDAGRAPGPVAEAITAGIGAYLQTLARHRPNGELADQPSAEDKARAVMTLSALVGGMVLSRATQAGNPALSDEMLAVLSQELGRYWQAGG